MTHISLISPIFKRLAVAFCAVAGSFAVCDTASAQQNTSLCPERPKLVLMIVVDNLNCQQLDIVREQCGTKGYNRFYTYGAQCVDAYYDAGGRFAGKNLATLFTGAPSSTHGIVGRTWIDAYTGKLTDAVYGVLPPSGVVDTLAQPHNGALLCNTISNEIRKIYNDKAKIISIGFDPQMLIWTSGTQAGEPYAWLDARSGKVLTANVSAPSMQKWIDDFNAVDMPNLYRSKIWAPRKDISEYHQSRYFGGKNTGGFYHQLGAPTNAKLPYSGVCGSPYGNSIIRDLAANAITYEELGKDEVPDLLMVQFTATPGMSKKRQPIDPETEDLLLGLDDNISSLLTLIDCSIGMENTLVVFTSAQGSYDVSNTDSPQWAERGSVSLRRATALLNLYLMALHGQAQWVKGFMPGTIYLDRQLAEEKKVDFDKLVDEAAEFLPQVAGIGHAIPTKNLDAIVSHSTAIETMRSNYHPKRSGDIILQFEPGWAEEMEDGSRQTQLWSGESVPLAFYGWKVPRAIIFERHNMADVAPTICSFIRVGFPNGCSGEPIKMPFAR